MELQNSFEIPTNLDHAWTVLMDIPRIAPCMPGAELTEVVDDRNFKGAAKIKVGPISLSFAGDAEIIEIDEANHAASVRAKGSDAKGRGNAHADVEFSLSEVDSARTRVDVQTNLNLTGSIAQYGRASGLIDEIAKQLIADFVKNLEDELARDASVATPSGETEAPGAAAAAGASEPSPPPPPRSAESISGISLFFRALFAMVKRWFGR